MYWTICELARRFLNCNIKYKYFVFEFLPNLDCANNVLNFVCLVAFACKIVKFLGGLEHRVHVSSKAILVGVFQRELYYASHLLYDVTQLDLVFRWLFFYLWQDSCICFLSLCVLRNNNLLLIVDQTLYLHLHRYIYNLLIYMREINVSSHSQN